MTTSSSQLPATTSGLSQLLQNTKTLTERAATPAAPATPALTQSFFGRLASVIRPSADRDNTPDQASIRQDQLNAIAALMEACKLSPAVPNTGNLQLLPGTEHKASFWNGSLSATILAPILALKPPTLARGVKDDNDVGTIDEPRLLTEARLAADAFLKLEAQIRKLPENPTCSNLSSEFPPLHQALTTFHARWNNYLFTLTGAQPTPAPPTTKKPATSQLAEVKSH